MPIFSKIGGCVSRGRPGCMTGSSIDISDFRFQIAEIHHLKSNLQSAIRNQQYQLPHPRRFTGSRQMLRPMAGAMMRSSAISRSNCDGNSDCAPSLSA